MAHYSFKAKDSQGKIKSGRVEARNLSEAKAKVQRRRLKLLSIKRISLGRDEKQEEKSLFGNLVYKDARGRIQISLGKELPTDKEIIVFTKQFSTMVQSGVPILQALDILSNQQSSRTLRKALKGVRSRVENGSSLSISLAHHKDIFDDLYIAMVEAGEASGNLDEILLNLVSYLEKSSRIKAQIKSAMVYPAVVVVVAVVVIVGLLLYVVPTFAEQYTDSGRQLPELTQLVISVSEWIQNQWFTVVSAVALLFAMFKMSLKTPKGKLLWDGIVLKLPGIGTLLRKVYVGRFSSTLSSMLASGVDLLEALLICSRSAGNKVIEEFIVNAITDIENGLKLSDPLSKGDLIPEMVISMITIGESTGALDDMLKKVSDFYEEEVDVAVQGLLSMIEPILIIVVGGVVGFIVVAMYLPIFDIAQVN